MDASSPLLPAVALVAVTAVVWVRLYVVRMGEIRRKGIDPQTLATARGAAELLHNVGAADNFRNLFEVPVLFYVLCLAVAVTGATSGFLAAGAWAYVVLRAAHSAVHCTYNNVTHRFVVYAASTVLLFCMWGIFGAKLLHVGVGR